MWSFSTPEVVLILLSTGVAIYFILGGYVLVRLIRYRGNLGPQPKRYIILPQYLKDAIVKEAEQEVARKGASGSDLNNDNEVYNIGSRFSTTLPTGTTAGFPSTALDPPHTGRFRGTMFFDPNVDPEDLPGRPSDSIKALLREQRRISHMPHFIQDDCGDGRDFPNVPAINPNDPNDPALLQQLRESREIHSPGFRKDPGKYMTMGLKKLDMSQWLVVDDTYLQFHAARTRLLARKKGEVVQGVAEREAVEACEELLREVVAFLTTTYGEYFRLETRGDGAKYVRNGWTGEAFRVQRPWEMHPLEVCARLAMEDFNLLVKSEFTGEHRLIASATLFPAGWILRERIGKSVTSLHGPVPLWKSKLSSPVEHYFTRLDSKSCMQRHSFFIQIQPDARPLEDLLFIQEGKDFFPGDIHNLQPGRIIVRRERQTFRRLTQSGAVCFTVKTSVQPLMELPKGEQRENLVREICSWPREIATYKGRDLWERAVYEFCLGREKAERMLEGGGETGALDTIDE